MKPLFDRYRQTAMRGSFAWSDKYGAMVGGTFMRVRTETGYFIGIRVVQ